MDENGGANAHQPVSVLEPPDPMDGTDWYTKLVRVERAKAIRREAQKAREGKTPLIEVGHGRRGAGRW